MAPKPGAEYASYADLAQRLDEIVAAVSDDALPLDDALALYEEAVSLGLRASDLLEQDIEEQRAAEGEAPAGQAVGGAAAEGAAEGDAPAGDAEGEAAPAR